MKTFFFMFGYFLYIFVSRKACSCDQNNFWSTHKTDNCTSRNLHCEWINIKNKNPFLGIRRKRFKTNFVMWLCFFQIELACSAICGSNFFYIFFCISYKKFGTNQNQMKKLILNMFPFRSKSRACQTNAADNQIHDPSMVPSFGFLLNIWRH